MSKQHHFITTAKVPTNYSPYAQYTRKAITAMHKATPRAGSGTQNTPKKNTTAISTRSGTTVADIDALFAARPLILEFALDAIEDRRAGSSIEAVQHLISALKLPAGRKGEDYNILRFEEEPLSYSLRITGRPNVMSGSVYIHKEAEGMTQEFPVNDEQDLKAIARHILTYKAQLESGTGFLRAVPKSDSALLAILKEKQWNEQHVPQFAEAQRAVARHCLLDATVELLTPFGLQPVEYERNRVLVDLLAKKTKQHEPVDIMIERLDKYLPLVVAQDSEDERSDSTYRSSQRFETPTVNVAAAVIITRLKSNYAVQIEEDSKRYPVHVLRGMRYPSCSNAASLPKRALVFDLSNHNDVVAFVSRILTQRNEIRTDYLEPFEILSERYGWGKRQHPRPRTQPQSQNEKRRVACRERETGLRAEVTVEALLEKDKKKAEMLRRQEEETRRKEEDLRIAMEKLDKMRANWAARVENMLDRVRERGGLTLDESSMSWADMVEDLGT